MSTGVCVHIRVCAPPPTHTPVPHPDGGLLRVLVCVLPFHIPVCLVASPRRFSKSWLLPEYGQASVWLRGSIAGSLVVLTVLQ